MKKNFEYLTRLREVMKQHGIDAVVITGTDPHQSELRRIIGAAANGSRVSSRATAPTAQP